jgi:hypothetical protein
MKFCEICNQLKPLTAFKQRQRKNNLYVYPYCFKCLVIKNKAYKDSVKDKTSLYEKQRYQAKKTDILLYQKERYSKNTEIIKAKVREYAKNNLEKVKKSRATYKRNRLNNDPIFKLRFSISRAVSQAIKKRNIKKDASIFKYLGYSVKELAFHLESRFENWMNWNNYGMYDLNTWNDNDTSTWKWNIDHIVPQSKLPFDSINHENFIKCWQLNNLRPYNAKLNCLESDRRTNDLRERSAIPYNRTVGFKKISSEETFTSSEAKVRSARKAVHGEIQISCNDEDK